METHCCSEKATLKSKMLNHKDLMSTWIQNYTQEKKEIVVLFEIKITIYQMNEVEL